jgi:MYXO-CTERM domain-containing protein
MRRRTFHASVALAALMWVAPQVAAAQSFPLESQWIPLRCGNAVMSDPYRDVPTALDERDVVGDQANPAGLRAADNQFLYLRVRVDGNPAPGGIPTRSVWGFAFDLDGNPETYEILITVSNVSALVSVYRNTSTTVPNSPADPADTPPVATYPQTTHSRIVGTIASGFGGNPDYLVDIAVPWSVLASLGFGPQTSVRAWAGTSSLDDRLDGDLACNAGAGGTLTASLGDATSFGPGGTGSGGNGGGPIPPVGQGGVEFEGGPGCSCDVSGRRDPGGETALLGCLALFLGAVRQRRHHRQ